MGWRGANGAKEIHLDQPARSNKAKGVPFSQPDDPAENQQVPLTTTHYVCAVVFPSREQIKLTVDASCITMSRRCLRNPTNYN